MGADGVNDGTVAMRIPDQEDELPRRIQKRRRGGVRDGQGRLPEDVATVIKDGQIKHQDGHVRLQKDVTSKGPEGLREIINGGQRKLKRRDIVMRAEEEVNNGGDVVRHQDQGNVAILVRFN